MAMNIIYPLKYLLIPRAVNSRTVYTNSIMIFITIFFVAILTLIQYFGLQGYLILLLQLPVEYHLGFLVLLIVVRAGIALYKVLPALKGFYRSLSRISSKIDVLSNKLDKTNGGPFNGPQKRGYSTSTRVNNKLTSNSPSKRRGGELKTIARENLTVKSKFSQLLSSRRIRGLFASIVENGSLVSLATVWQRADSKVRKEDVNKFISNYLNEGIQAKARRNSDGTYHIVTQKHGTVADLITAFGWRIISLAFPNKVKFSGRLRLLAMFSNYIWRMYTTNGSVQVVKFLKAGQLAIQKSIGKDRITSLRQLDKDLVRSRLTSQGLPTIIPSRDRRLIAGGSASVIRFWLTLFSIYRVISIPGTLKLSTIVSPLDVKISEYNEVVSTFKEFLSSTKIETMFNTSILTREADILLFEAASATQKVAWSGLFRDPSLLVSVGAAVYLRKILGLLNQSRLLDLFNCLVEIGISKGLDFRRPHLNGIKDIPTDSPYSHSIIANPEGQYIGKLSIKEEAAGKLRVFAMTDIWTQMCLKPIEQMLAAFLKNLPNDGVYDQHSSEMRARDKSIRYGCSYGYDLSAATDRLPLELQEMILDQIVPNLGTFWGPFLTRRDYYLYLPDNFAKEIGAHKSAIAARAPKGGKAPNTLLLGGIPFQIYYNSDGKPWVRLQYAVGQPMGALSSFAMLAVTHHLIAQLAYRVAYKVPDSTPWTKDTWYTGYECTGDDIIFFDKFVAEEYLSLMTDFGVPINTTKSVIATVPCTEYLKVTSLHGENVGAISWKMLMSGNSLMGRANILFFMLSKGIIRKNIMPWIERSARPSFHKPGLLSPTLIAMWTMLANRGLITVDEALKALIDGKTPVFRLARAILMNANVKMISQLLPAIIRDGIVRHIPNHNVEYLWSFEKPWFEHAMYSPLAVFIAKTDLGTDSTELTKEMLKILTASIGIGSHIEGFDLDSFISNELSADDVLDFGSLDMNSPSTSEIDEETVLKNDIRVLFWSLRTYMVQKLSISYDRIINSNPNWGTSTSSELAKANEELSRYNELKELVIRYEQKVDPDYNAPPARIIRASELRLVQLLRRLGNRPLFTTSLNRGERGQQLLNSLRANRKIGLGS